jgi:hypothetical protein
MNTLSKVLQEASWSQIVFNWTLKDTPSDTEISWSSLHPKEALHRYLLSQKMSAEEIIQIQDLANQIIDVTYSEDESD